MQNYKGGEEMQANKSMIAKGLGAAAVITGATAMVGGAMRKGSTKRRARRTARKAVKAMEGIVNEIHSVMK